MKTLNWRIVLGVALLILGGVALLQAMGVIPTQGILIGLFFAAVFALAGAAFLYVMFSNRASWWAAIPGFTLLALAALIFLGVVAPHLAEVAGGAVFLGGVSLSFWAVYLLNRRLWWAIIPGGATAAIALITVIPDQGTLVPAVLFLGWAATFGLVAFLPHEPSVHLRWAWIPAGVMLIMGVAFLIAAGPLVGLVWPVVLILAGLFLLGRSYLKR